MSYYGIEKNLVFYLHSLQSKSYRDVHRYLNTDLSTVDPDSLAGSKSCWNKCLSTTKDGFFELINLYLKQ